MESDNNNNNNNINKNKQPGSSSSSSDANCRDSSSSLLTATANDPIMKSSTTKATNIDDDDDDDEDHCCNDDNNDDDDDDEEEKEIKYVEFYSGIGGWTMALQESLDRLGPLLKLSSNNNNNNNNSNSHRRSRRSRRYKLKRLAALDHSDLCVQVFSHNFDKKNEDKNKEEDENKDEETRGETVREKQRREKQKQQQQRNGQQQQHTKTTFSIERLSIRQIEEWSADIWCMSPPCQPHTRQHDSNNNSKDVDPRSKSFLKICEWLDSKKNKDSNDSDSDDSDSGDSNNNKSKSKSNNNNNNYCLQDKYLPSLIFLENVIGFEVSNSFERWTTALQSRNYFISNFHLSPTQIKIPNDRPRYYCIAIRGLSLPKSQNLQIQIETATLSSSSLSTSLSSSLSQDVPSAESLLSYFSKMDNNNNNGDKEDNMNIGSDENTTNTTTATADTTTFKPPVPPRIWKSIPELFITSSEDASNTSKRTTEILPISSFLDNNQNNPSLSSLLSSSSSSSSTIPIPIRREDLYVPEKVLNNKSSWCFDIVCPTDHRSSCFTHSYGRYIKGTGSILYENDDVIEKNLLLLPPSEREFCSNWMNELNIDGTKLRYFSGSELARLFGFPTTKFVFPPQITNKQQWKLIGNSLNVGIASKLIDLGLLLRYYYYNDDKEDEDEYHHQQQHQQQQQKQRQQNDGV